MPEAADEKRLGELLVTTGRLSNEQLLAALEWQRQQGGPQRKRLGEILVEQGLISVQDLQAILTEQGKQILWCPRCRLQVNVQGTAPEARYGCQQCHGELQATPAPRSPAVRETWTAMPMPVSEDLSPEVRQALADPSRRIDRYAILSEIGRGGMGVVYRCHDPQLNRTVAIKMILETGGADAEELARFQLEALAVARIQHPGIVTLLGAGEHEGRPYLIMDFVEGETFNDLLKREKTSARRIAEIVREVSLALDHAHAMGIIHRDVKPQNIIIDPQGKPHVMDFGLARDTSARQQLTLTGQIMGTPAYMAPEQADADMGVHGPWTDVYALGAVLYRALTGRPVFNATGPVGMLKKVLIDEPQRLRRLDPTIPPDLEVISLRCLEKEPHRRYPSAAAVADELELFLDGRAIQARPAGQIEEATRGVQRNLVASLSVLTATLVAVSAIAAFAYMSDGQEKARRDQIARPGATEKTNDEGHERRTDATLTSRPHAAASAPPARPKETGTTSAEDWYDRGQDKLIADDTDGAIADFSRAIKIDPQLPGAWLARGKAQSTNGKPRVAMADFNRAIEIDPNLAEAWLERGNARADLRQPEEAIADFTKAIELDPSSWMSWKSRARQRFKTGDQAGADEDRAKAISLSPSEQLRLGAKELAAGDHEAAIAAYNRAVELNPKLDLTLKRAKVWADRGTQRYHQGDLDGAIADFTRVIVIRPKAATYWFNRGDCRRLKGDVDDAISDFTRAIEIDPNLGSAWNNRGVSRADKGDYDGAIADYTRAIEIAPRDAGTWSNRGLSRNFRGDLAGAIADCSRATQIEPNHGAAWFNLGGVLLKKKDLDGAISAFSRAIKIHPEMARAWTNRADARRAKGDIDGAINDCNRAIEIDPNNTTAWNLRGHARHREGDIDGAIADWERLLELAPNDPQAPTVRAEIQKLRAQQAKTGAEPAK